jgi:hypothetical protein
MRRMNLLLTLIILAITFPVCAETLALQSFESTAADTWSYTANPTPDSRRIWWGPISENMVVPLHITAQCIGRAGIWTMWKVP